MGKKRNAKQRRETEASRRRDLWSPQKKAPAKEPRPAELPAPKPKITRPVPDTQQTAEEEAKFFLENLDRYDQPVCKDDMPGQTTGKPKQSSFIQTMNIKADMPLVEEALNRLRTNLQEMRANRVKAVKLIHGYGSTGRGGKIRTAAREELAAMKRRGYVKDFIPGEDFGPLDAASRKLVEQNSSVSRDPDYGSINQGITIIVL